MFKGAGGSLQVHDFNPGEENGLFWTTPIPKGSVDVDLEDGRASLVLRSFEIDDYGDVANALSGGDEIATAALSLRIDWRGVTRRASFVDADLPTPFAARVALTGATMRWSAVEGGGTITGHPSSAPDFAMLAKERNGVFFTKTHEG